MTVEFNPPSGGGSPSIPTCSDIEEILTDIESLIMGISSDLSVVKSDVQLIRNSEEETNGIVKENRGLLNTIEDRTGDIRSTQNQHGNWLERVLGDVTNGQFGLAALGGAMLGLTGTANATKGLVDTTAKTTASTFSKVLEMLTLGVSILAAIQSFSLGKQLEALEGELITQSNRIQETVIAQHFQTKSGINLRLDQIKSAIAENFSAILVTRSTLSQKSDLIVRGMEALYTVFQALSGLYFGLSRNIEGSLKDLQNQIGIFNNGLSALNSKASSIQNSVNTVDGKVSAVDFKVSGVDAKVSGVDSRLNQANQKLEKIDRTVNTIPKEFPPVNQKLDEINGKLNGLASKPAILPQTLPPALAQSIKELSTKTILTTVQMFPRPNTDTALLTGAIVAGVTPLIRGSEDRLQRGIPAAVDAAFCSPSSCGGGKLNQINNGVNRNGGRLDGLNAALSGADLAQNSVLLRVIDGKLGPQLPGGISGWLGKFAKSLHLDKVLNMLTTVTVLHNAAMLSTNLAQTLGDVASTAINTLIIRDENADQIDVNEILAKQFDQWAAGLLGQDVWTGVKLNWNKANRIVSTASNIVWSVRSIADSAREIGEWTAENTGKIGNALKRDRVVSENAYPWMPERVSGANAAQRKLQRMRDNLEPLDDAASSLQGVLGEVGSITSEINELREAKERFDTEISTAPPKPRTDNTPVKDAADSSDAASVSPTTTLPDRGKAEG
jgi:peptidoglycan hydrolase CwlO-like protein